MKKIKKLFLFFVLLICGCNKVNFEGKVFIYNNLYEYSFISNYIVQYKNIKNNFIIDCRYTRENNNMIKVRCNKDVKLLLYDKDNDCIYDHNSRIYCTK